MCLNVPCNRFALKKQIGAETKNLLNGFNTTDHNPILTVNGKCTTITYGSLSNLPIIYASPGINTYHQCMAYICHAYPAQVQPNHPPLNLSKPQWQKRYLHEACTYEGFTNLNKWIRFPHVDKSLEFELDDAPINPMLVTSLLITNHLAPASALTAWRPVPQTGYSPPKVWLLPKGINMFPFGLTIFQV